MRVLLINFEMDTGSPVLPWQARVATALAGQCESVHVLTEKVGSYEKRDNLTVNLIPRWPWGVPKRFGGGWLVNWQLYRLLRRYPCDVCFVHMAQAWSYRLWPVLTLFRLPVLLWYAHGSVTKQLHWALRCADRVVTSTPEGFRIPSPKVHVIGQAIDTAVFQPPATPSRKAELVYVGRISERKRVLEMLDVLAALRRLDPARDWTLRLIGPTLTPADETYKARVASRIAELGLASAAQMPGPLEQGETVGLYKTAALHLNLSETGSMDKTVMEALACGCPVLTTNIAFRETLADYPDMFSTSSDPETLAQRILAIQDKAYAPQDLRGLVLGKHDFEGWIGKIHSQLLAIRKG